MKKKSNKNKRGSAAFLAVILSVIIAFIGVIIYYQVSKSPRAQTTSALTSSESASENSQKHSDKIDAEKYYKENSQNLICVTPAEKSKKVYSEKQVAKELTARGFGKNSSITYDYNLDGSVKKKTKVSNSSSAKHPQYTVIYMTESGDYWTVSVCENSITAYPVTYNSKRNGDTELIVAESDSITAYDSQTNSFYESIPKKSVLELKKIPAVTAKALEQLTAQKLERL